MVGLSSGGINSGGNRGGGYSGVCSGVYSGFCGDGNDGSNVMKADAAAERSVEGAARSATV